MPQVVISEFMDESSVENLRSDFDVLYDPTLVDRHEELGEAVADARALVVRNRTRVTDDLLNLAPELVVVGRLGVGLDNIDIKACEERRVKVCPATGANDLAVAEYVTSTALMLLRAAYQAESRMVAGEWPRQAMIGRELSGKVMGLVGFGSIARQAGDRARSLGMKVAAADPFVASDDPAWSDVERHDSLEDLLPAVDVLSLHVPLTKQTRGMIDAAALGRMHKGAVLINTARGGIVDERALADSLRAGHIAGAALDVFEDEPLTAKAAAQFEGLTNLILTPHIAGVTEESNVRVSAVTAANIRAELLKQKRVVRA